MTRKCDTIVRCCVGNTAEESFKLLLLYSCKESDKYSFCEQSHTSCESF